ncbi:hypothetical protein FGADI_1029 [Fusarium gaditjirri]|uniref:F-box domain-containing protein n=1 Tax=Fusarium gaditjirri TaxID=282569 RepID=A0A8H4TM43_9HYPO|nr:hypothetical protein FGADI_1029 [Fusarium gaditjirri]
MPYFQLKPQFSARPLMQRLVDIFRPRLGSYYVPILEAKGDDSIHSDMTLLDEYLSEPQNPQKPACHQNSSSRLLNLPQELLVQVMLNLPHSSLYMVRRTCRVLRNMTDDVQFKAFQTDILRQGGEHSCLTKAGFDELRMIKRILLRSALCKPCGRLFDSGELQRRLKDLWRLVACKGCRNFHPALLFPQGRQGSQPDGNICVGLMGKLSICKHLKVTGQIQPRYTGEKETVKCTDSEHLIMGGKDSENLPTFQNYGAGVSIDSENGLVSTVVSKSFPLAKVDPQQYPGLEVLKRHLMKQITQLDSGSLCPHAWSQLDSIVSCIGSGDCTCFPPFKAPFSYGSRWTYLESTRCQQHEYLCRRCKACYFWVADTDYIVLHVRITSRMLGPDRMSWLSNLTFESEYHPILNRNTEGILWCADPGCGTGYDHRWLMMVDIFERASLSWYYPYYHSPYRDLRLSHLSLEYETFEEREV